MSGVTVPKRPVYARVLRLRYMHPGGLLCFFFFEGMILLAILLALAELVTWWVVIILPVSVATMVKINDVIAGLSFVQRGKRVLPRRIPAVARGSAAVQPTVAGPAPQQSGLVVGRAIGRAVGTASAPGAPGRITSPNGRTPGHPDPNHGPSGTNHPNNGSGAGRSEAPEPTTRAAGDQRGDGPSGEAGGHALTGDQRGHPPAGEAGPDAAAGPDPAAGPDTAAGPDAAAGPDTPLPRRRAAWSNQRRFERPI